jgi:hypothetical protein
MTTMALGLALLLAAPQGTAAPSGFAGEVAVGAPITRGNLTVFPLRPRQAAAAQELRTLDEAMRRKELVVVEAGAGGAVNALAVENRGDEPVMLLAGELLLGGKQDRIIGRSLVLAPRSRAQVPVFCVEHGRWSGAGAFDSGDAMGHVALRRSAIGGDQAEVWAEVARSNARLGTRNASDTYRTAARKLGGDAGPLSRELSAALAREEGAAGLAVAIDGEVVAVEWFASPATFARVREKLVASYAAQALQALQARDPAAPAAPPVQAARAEAVADFAARAERGGAIAEQVRDAEGKALQTTYLKK